MKIFYILFSSLMILSCEAQEKVLNIEELRKTNGAFYFKGYCNDLIVFDDIENNILYTTKDLKSFTIFKKYNENLSIKYVNQSGFVYTKNDTLICELFSGKKDLFVSNSNVLFVTANNNLSKIVFNNKDWRIEIWDRINNKVESYGLKGGMPYLVDDLIYYLDKRELKQLSLDGKIKRTILENVTGDPWILSQDGSYAFVMSRKEDVGLKPSIYNFNKKEFNFVNIGLGYLVFYSPDSQVAYFYNVKTLDFKPFYLNKQKFN